MQSGISSLCIPALWTIPVIEKSFEVIRAKTCSIAHTPSCSIDTSFSTLCFFYYCLIHYLPYPNHSGLHSVPFIFNACNHCKCGTYRPAIGHKNQGPWWVLQWWLRGLQPRRRFFYPIPRMFVMTCVR